MSDPARGGGSGRAREHLRVAVVGAGAVGCFYGARLLKAGEEVSFLARGAQLEALRERGLTLRVGTGEAELAVEAVPDPSSVGPVDLVLFCVKSHDAAEAARSLQPLVGPGTVVLALQNGLDHVEVVSEAVGPERVLVGSVQALAVEIVAPGVVEHNGGEGRIVFGEPEGGSSERTSRLGEVFSRAGIPHELSGRMTRVLWEKFLFIAGVGGVTALARAPIGGLLGNPRGQALLRDSCEEIVAVARAEGVELGPDPVGRVLRFAGTFPPGWRSSMGRDLEAGRRLEIDALSGAVVRRAEERGLPAPVHRVISACLSVNRPDGG